MNCLNCNNENLSSWKYCPHCGVLKQESTPPTKPKLKSSAIPERFLNLAEAYFELTGLKLEGDILENFINHPKAGRLSVIENERRLKAGKKVRKPLSNGKYSLSMDAWLDEIYDNPQPLPINRVWITSGGAKYHVTEDCPGIKAGQNFAQAKGKDTYKPQFVLLRDAAFVNEFKPCEICKPPKYLK